MKAHELEKRFDAGEDISKYLDMTKARRPGQEQKRVNVDFPLWMVRLLDKEAKCLDVPRNPSSESGSPNDLKRHPDIMERSQ